MILAWLQSIGSGTVGSVILALIGGGFAIWRQREAREAVREAAADKLKADQEAARAQKELAEVRAREEAQKQRHLQEAQERLQDRQQKEALISALQAQTADTMEILKTELSVQQKTSDRAFDVLDRNTRALETLTQIAQAQGNQIGLLATQLSRIEGAVVASRSAHS